MSATEQPSTVIASGDLTQTPVLHLLLYLHERGSDGTLVLASPTGQRSMVKFRTGRPIAGRFPHESGGGLQTGLFPLFGYMAGNYEFHGADLLPSGPGVHEGVVDPLAAAGASLQAYCRDDMADALLARYGDHPMRLQPGRPIERLRLDGGASGLLEVLRASPDTVDNLVRYSPLDRLMSRRVLYLLVVTRMVAPFQGDQNASKQSRVRSSTSAFAAQARSGRARPSSGGSRASDAAGSAARVLSRPARPLSGTSGASSDGGPSDRPRKRPTNGTGSISAVEGLVSMRPFAGAVVRATVESHVDESDPDVRFRRATNRLKAGKHLESVEIMQSLLDEFPDEAHFHAMLAHGLWEGSRGAPEGEGVPRNLTDALKRALQLDGECARALYVKGLLYKQADKHRKALSCFRRAAKADRNLLDAQRQARLLERRLKS